jgi:hypothetical protein
MEWVGWVGVGWGEWGGVGWGGVAWGGMRWPGGMGCGGWLESGTTPSQVDLKEFVSTHVIMTPGARGGEVPSRG